MNKTGKKKIPKLTQCSSIVWRHHCFQEYAQTKVVSIQIYKGNESNQATLIRSTAKAIYFYNFSHWFAW